MQRGVTGIIEFLSVLFLFIRGRLMCAVCLTAETKWVLYAKRAPMISGILTVFLKKSYMCTLESNTLACYTVCRCWWSRSTCTSVVCQVILSSIIYIFFYIFSRTSCSTHKYVPIDRRDVIDVTTASQRQWRVTTPSSISRGTPTAHAQMQTHNSRQFLPTCSIIWTQLGMITPPIKNA